MLLGQNPGKSWPEERKQSHLNPDVGVLLCVVISFCNLQAIGRLTNFLLAKPHSPLLEVLWGNWKCPRLVRSNKRKEAAEEHSVCGGPDIMHRGAKEQPGASKSNWQAVSIEAQDIPGEETQQNSELAACSQRHRGSVHCHVEIQGPSRSLQLRIWS